VKPWLKTLLAFTFVSAASVFGTLLVLILLAGGFRRPTSAEKVPVSFTEFLFLVESGRVAEIRVDGREYTFVVVDGARRTTRTTFGPATTFQEMQSVRPTDPGLAPPKVIVVGGG
jgi:hypothetical protein